MKLKLYVIPASHPSDAVRGALRLKGLDYRRVDLPAGSLPAEWLSAS